MKYETLLGVFIVLQTSNALQFTNENFYNITPGVPFNITWKEAAGPVTLTLLKGSTIAYLKAVDTIASAVEDNYYTWTPSSSHLSDSYCVQFDDGSDKVVHGFAFNLIHGALTSTATIATALTTGIETTTAFATTWLYP